MRWILLKFYNVKIGNTVIKTAKRIFNSDEICRSYSDLNFGVTFLEHSVFYESYLVIGVARIFSGGTFLIKKLMTFFAASKNFLKK